MLRVYVVLLSGMKFFKVDFRAWWLADMESHFG